MVGTRWKNLYLRICATYVLLAIGVESLTVVPEVKSVRGGNTTLYCSVDVDDSKLSTTFTWTKTDGNELVASFVSQTPLVSGSLEGRGIINPPYLVITDTRVDDAGEYVCMAIVPGRAPASGKTVVSVHAAPRMSIKIAHEPTVGADGFYTAAVCSAESGFPTPMIEWIDASTKEVKTAVSKNVTILDDGTIDVTLALLLTPGIIGRATNSTTPLSTGETTRNFTCQVTHPEMSNDNQADAEIDLLYSPLVDIKLKSNELTCVASGNPEPTIAWTTPDGNIIKDQKTIYIDPSTPQASSGRYVCSAKNGLSPPGITAVNIAKPSTIPVMFTSTLVYNTSIAENTANFKIHCSVEVTSPSASSKHENYFTWSKDNNLIKNGVDNYRYNLKEVRVSPELFVLTSTLVIDNIRRGKDEGEYACKLGIVKNTGYMKAVERKVLISVDYAPVDSVTSLMITPSKKIKEGDYVRLLCTSHAQPSPNFKWYFEGYEVGNSSELFISDVNRYQSGEYTCVAYNYVPGSGRVSKNLIVNFPPSNVSIVVDDDKLRCNADGGSYPPPVYSWILPNGTITTGNRSIIKVLSFDVDYDTAYICQVKNNLYEAQNGTFIITPLPTVKIGSLTVAEFVITILACSIFLFLFIIGTACAFRYYRVRNKRANTTISKRSLKYESTPNNQYSEPSNNGRPVSLAQDSQLNNTHTFAHDRDEDTNSFAESQCSSVDYNSSDESNDELKSLPVERQPERGRPTFSTFSTLPPKGTVFHSGQEKRANYKSVDGLDNSCGIEIIENKCYSPTQILPADAYVNGRGKPNSKSSSSSHLTALYDDAKPKVSSNKMDAGNNATTHKKSNKTKNDSQSSKAESQVDPSLAFSPPPPVSSYEYMALRNHGNQSRQLIGINTSSPLSYNNINQSTPMVSGAKRVLNEGTSPNNYYGSVIATSQDKICPGTHHPPSYRSQHIVDRNDRQPSPYDSGGDSVYSGSTGTTSTSRRLQSLTLV